MTWIFKKIDKNAWNSCKFRGKMGKICARPLENEIFWKFFLLLEKPSRFCFKKYLNYPQGIILSLVMPKTVNLGLYAHIRKNRENQLPDPWKIRFLESFLFYLGDLKILLPTSPKTPSGDQLRLSYAQNSDLGPIYPNMVSQP